jgi:hypothetical protein
MAEPRDCPVCGGPIMITYIRPDFDFYIEDGKIQRDTNGDLWYGKDPYLEFYCTNDKTHDLEQDLSIVEHRNAQQEWQEDVQKEFYEKIFGEL